MANKLRVEQLRAELGQRGLDNIGNKASLVQRLEDAIHKDKKQSVTVDSTKESKKRGRDIDNDDTNGEPDKTMAIEKFRGMAVKQLREEATSRGLATTGNKKQLLHRLCEDVGNDSHNNLQDGEANEKIVTVAKKGSPPLDQWLPDHMKAEYHVFQLGDDIYDAMLNQTNVGDNNNKFYVIQLLESHDGCSYICYNRWGRVGVKGQNKIFGPYTTLDKALKEFEMKFFDKTKNNWSDRKNFVCYPKCYTWLEMDYSEEKEMETESVVNEKPDPAQAIHPHQTKLDPRVANFISLICNFSMMAQQMMELGYNANKLPLGKLSKSTILKGYDVLKRIADVIGQSDRGKLDQLSGEFYTVIPHDFGFKRMCNFVIDTPQKLKMKLELVEALGEIEVATKLLKDEPGLQEDPLFSHYQRLNCELRPVDADSEEFFMIAKYMQNTHAKTHSSYVVDIVQIFKVAREGEIERFSKFCNTKNRMLLWHGSRLTNWTGILSQGLRIAPPEAPVTGYMFGKGVYFADMFSKSANYCYANRATRAGVLLLCEVALGDMAELLTAKYDADNLPEGKLSTKGVGTTSPDLSEAQALEDGTIVPLGKPKEQEGHQGSLLYNEYIVYTVDQIRMRYVVQVNFKFK
ncbi:PARP domain-containing protein/SAP domain-containing protein/PARP_reg domain-containing protein/WGR domain-containing protein [Cephalotus follicularis]|uniref:Poly [ADP-ribose] polymerase n=1 Tax=Cephalotus follicularis TaxID=3775 RepID=A0A1Q3BGH9_CEPFO|nr:PARP domain-containing protein/SAP domain-containing protein/PARP_reg domain-containing protein/WGR domain-containing protein [Cephalotus follicularis]